jgi:hypothetical protein
VIPEGEHTVELRFEPDSYYEDMKISYAAITILYLAIIAGFILSNKQSIIKQLKNRKLS